MTDETTSLAAQALADQVEAIREEARSWFDAMESALLAGKYTKASEHMNKGDDLMALAVRVEERGMTGYERIQEYVRAAMPLFEDQNS